MAQMTVKTDILFCSEVQVIRHFRAIATSGCGDHIGVTIYSPRQTCRKLREKYTAFDADEKTEHNLLYYLNRLSGQLRWLTSCIRSGEFVLDIPNVVI